MENKIYKAPVVKVENDILTLYGIGKFNCESQTFNKVEAGLLYIELHKFLFPEIKDDKDGTI